MLTKIKPFILLIIYFIFIIVFLIKAPDPKDFLEIVKNLYATYGYPLIFTSAIIESIFLTGLYFPGSTIVLTGAAVSKTGILYFPFVLTIGTAGLLTGYTISYFLGKYGWYKIIEGLGFKKGIETAKNKLEKHSSKVFFLGFFYPESASFISIASGILKIPFKRFLFLSTISQIFWSILWGSLAYILGLSLIEFFIKYLFLIFVIIIVLILLKKVIFKRKVNS